MKGFGVPLILLTVVVAASGKEKRDPDIIVYFHSANESLNVVGPAEGEARQMLASVGISVAWRSGKLNYNGRAEVIEAVLTDQPDDSVEPGALAFATLGPQSGTRIEIFHNRMRAHSDLNLSSILAHVLVHEITHILEGVPRHSETGVMKAHWDAEDWNRMRRGPLPFADEDVRLIHVWAERHNGTLLAALR